MAIGQTNLALIIALFSVSTTIAAIGLPLLKPKASDIKLIYVGPESKGSVFLARNDGRSGGAFGIIGFKVRSNSHPDKNAGFGVSDEESAYFYVQSGKEERFVVPATNIAEKIIDSLDQIGYFKHYGTFNRSAAILPSDTKRSGMESMFNIGHDMAFVIMLKDLKCSFSAGIVDFYDASFQRFESTPTDVPAECMRVPWMTNALRKASYGITPN